MNAPGTRTGEPRSAPTNGKSPSAAVRELQSAQIQVGHVDPTGMLPVCEATSEVDAPVWAEQYQGRIDAVLRGSGALLMRGFGVHDAHAFVRIAEALSPGIEADYSELPRDESGECCYRSTPYPESLPILFHNEAAHRIRWPSRQLFCCVEASPEGGATPLADGRNVMAALDAAIVDSLRERGLLYLRNFSAAFDLDWPDYYGSHSASRVEAACVRDGTDFEWTAAGLRTWQNRPALERSPDTGEELPFHQILLHHPRCLPADVRRALEAECAEDAMPRNVFYGDGERIEDAVVDEIQRAYASAAFRFRWRSGDVLFFDNLRVAHARDAFSGPRTVLVALGAFADGTYIGGDPDGEAACGAAHEESR